ncbi:thiosulfate sulfurtransferase 18-like isoform X1 [Rutidosis leptorrhynchoides]|uniref:thiosulfate sulfurtransferase 18-like isoform X1 n=1 Tax=Rutidosis leptorrhynchoides TaxID=125765 RepID=UPI003A9A0BC6
MFNTPEGRVKNPNFMEQVLPVCTKDDHLIVGCQSGVRSVYATTDMLEVGFKHVYNMGGGYLAWVQNELPVTPNETSNVATGSASPTVSLPKPINNAKMI